ncbi:hypothetical protein [Iamia sp.]|uniref:hypothetical protein n=1 Tax=Iamia sp. TaxID=2722710 RepID=UPI002C1DB082|nr:hypothetical protein [Iamia sp.]HXH57504.1 hypothetical protein [Iamia sp.]
MLDRARRALSVLILGLAVAGCGFDDAPAAESPNPTTTELPEVSRRCDLGRRNDQGVAGHDLAAAAELPDGRVLFTFGDTYLGEVEGDTRRTTGLINSSAALLPAGDDICDPSLSYLTDLGGGIRPLLPRPPKEGTAYWPVDVSVIDGRVWMLYRWVERTGDGTLDLRILGTGMAVADPEELIFAAADDLLVEGADPLPASITSHRDELVAVVCAEADRPDCRLHPIDTEANEIGPARAEPPIPLAAPEMSLARVEIDGQETWRASSMPLLRCRLRVAVLEGDEWQIETVLAPEVTNDGLCYAGRVQEAFSDADRLFATWVESPEQRSDGDVYWPHVERIDLTDR